MRFSSKIILAFIVVGSVLDLFAAVPTETQTRVASAQAQARLMLAPEVIESEDGDFAVPDDVFRITLEMVLENHAGRRPNVDSVFGERFRALYREERRAGLTPALRLSWIELFWAWREELDR